MSDAFLLISAALQVLSIAALISVERLSVVPRRVAVMGWRSCVILSSTTVLLLYIMGKQ